MFNFMPAWLEGIFDIVSRIGKVIWMIIQVTWPLILFLGSFLYAMWEIIAPLIDQVTAQTDAMVSVLTNSADSMQDLAAAGWPPEFASGIFYANQHAPLAELVGMILALAVLFIVCAIIRVVKSLLIVVGG